VQGCDPDRQRPQCAEMWEAPYATVEERFSAPTMQFHRTLPFS
jgi:hypothetical protein